MTSGRRTLPARYVLYQGTLEPRKNVDRLVQAFAGLVRRGRPALAVLAGAKAGASRPFAAVERLGLRERVIIPGYVDRREQPLWYNAWRLRLPSQYEGFGPGAGGDGLWHGDHVQHLLSRKWRETRGSWSIPRTWRPSPSRWWGC